MSLNFNLGETEYFKQSQAQQDKEWPLVSCLIQFTMVLGVSGINDKNKTEVFRRLGFYEALHGGLCIGKDGDKPFPRDIVRKMVGLTTNVRQETWGQFVKRVTQHWIPAHKGD
jgi:hypothetical protein